MLKEFRDFLIKGNIVDLAVAVILGGAFAKVVGALVDNIIMPLIGIVIGGIDFTKIHFTVKGVDVYYGLFIQAVVLFVIVGFILFLVLKAINKFKKEEVVEEEVTRQEELLGEIRDLLKK